MSEILEDVKKVVGVHSEIGDFDTDIKMAVNTAIFELMQLGVGPPEGFEVRDGSETWDQLLSNREDLNAVKSYVYVAVRLLFDRPETSYGIQALERMKAEWAWRLEIQRRIDQ